VLPGDLSNRRESFTTLLRDAQGIRAPIAPIGLSGDQPQALQLIDNGDQAAGMHVKRCGQLPLALTLRPVKNAQDSRMLRR